MDSNVRVHTDRVGLKEILEGTDVKPRMIRWTLLLQEFDLQILQRKEEIEETFMDIQEIAPPKEVSSIYIHVGTTQPKRKFSISR